MKTWEFLAKCLIITIKCYTIYSWKNIAGGFHESTADL